MTVSNLQLGIDIGGTFTDLVLFEEGGKQLWHHKVSTTPSDPAEAVCQGFQEIVDRAGCRPGQVESLVHGTTLGLNTIIERRGSRTGFLVTRGFRDMLLLGRLRLPLVNHLYADRQPPLVPRVDVVEIDERLSADGSVLRGLCADEVVEAARQLQSCGIKSIAICFLHSYRSPIHEQQAAQAIRTTCPDLYVSLSSEVWPQQREYERALVATMNAYIGSRLEHYLATLTKRLAEIGFSGRIYSTRSNGGIMTASAAAAHPIETLLSGPASGVIGALHIARMAGESTVIAFDMGGTTADVCVLNDEVPYSFDTEVSGMPLVLPTVDISSIGAGGGSIAWIDSAGLLKIGPQSAGADPGPACFDRHGIAATITDAYVVTGLLAPDDFLGGRLRLRPDLANQAVDRLACEMRLTRSEVARAILEIATANMYAQLIPLMGRLGVNHEDFTLLAYGGAGPTHAFMLAEAVGIRRVLVPPHPGTLCAFGCLAADFRTDFIQSVSLDQELSDCEFVSAFATLEERGRQWLAQQQVTLDGVDIVRWVEARYRGQAYDLLVPLTAEHRQISAVIAAFRARHLQLYGYADHKGEVELVALRLQIVGKRRQPVTPLVQEHQQPPTPLGYRQIDARPKSEHAALFRRDDLVPGQQLSGPLLVTQFDTTTYVPTAWRLRVLADGSLLGESARHG